MSGSIAARPQVAVGLKLALLGGFMLLRGQTLIPLPESSQRLLALLALRGRPVKRLLVAVTLWPNATESHATASLRAAVLRLNRLVIDAVEVHGRDLCLPGDVRVDLDEARVLAHHLLETDDPILGRDVAAAALAALSEDLLPGWYDDWVLVEAEDWRELRLHSLEALAGLMTRAGRHGDAIAAARMAVRADPIRESSHGALIRAYLAEGNPSEALSEFKRYRAFLRAELDLEPTPQLGELVQQIRHTVTAN